MLKTIFSIIIWPIWITAFLMCAALYLVLLTFLPPQKMHFILRAICRFLLLSAGQHFRVEGTVPALENGPYLYLFNHESMFDVFMMPAGISHYFSGIGANYQFSWPVWGFLLKRYGIAPIKRRELNSAIDTLKGVEKAISNGISFMIAPEGTRTLTGALGTFKKGPFHLAKNTNVTIIPVALLGVFKAKSKLDWKIKPGILTLRFGSPIKSTDYADLSVEKLRDLVQQKIVTLLK